MEDRWVDEVEAERITGRKRQSWRNDRSLGRGVPYYKIFGTKSVRYKLSEILSALEASRVETRRTGGAK